MRRVGVLRRMTPHAVATASLTLAGTAVLVLATASRTSAQQSHPVTAASPLFEPVDLRPAPHPVPPEYFGIHIHRAIPDASGMRAGWPSIGIGSWRIWDANVSWAEIEPAPGVWRFDRLDSLVALARVHGVAIYLTLGRTPRWASSRPTEPSAYGSGEQAPPADIATWTAYVDTIAKRYRGRIAAYEIWNEPNMPGFFSGTPDDLVALASAAYPAIKRADSTTAVISPSTSGGMRGVAWLSLYLQQGGAQFTDVVGFHAYATNEAPEAILPSLRAAVEVARSTHGGIPLWVTEIGWFFQNSDHSVTRSPVKDAFDATVLPDTLAAAFVARALILARCAGADRVMWYAWDNYRMGMTESDLATPKLPARAYATTAEWMTGKTVRRCVRDRRGRWKVTLATGIRPVATLTWYEGPRNLPAALDPTTHSAIGEVRSRAARRRLVDSGLPFAQPTGHR